MAKARGWNQTRLAEELGATPSDITNWKVRGLPPERYQVVAKVLGTSIDALVTGRYNTTAPMLTERPPVEYMPSRDSVPLVSWVAAGDWAAVADPYQPGGAEEWFVCPARHSPRSYALRVRGLSMFNPSSALSFSDGDIIFVDPERDAIHGALVIARLEADTEATFKRLIVEGDQRLLEALNPAWPNRILRIDGDATLCGVVIGKYQPIDLL